MHRLPKTFHSWRSLTLRRVHSKLLGGFDGVLIIYKFFLSLLTLLVTISSVHIFSSYFCILPRSSRGLTVSHETHLRASFGIFSVFIPVLTYPATLQQVHQSTFLVLGSKQMPTLGTELVKPAAALMGECHPWAQRCELDEVQPKTTVWFGSYPQGSVERWQLCATGSPVPVGVSQSPLLAPRFPDHLVPQALSALDRPVKLLLRHTVPGRIRG